MLNKQVKDNYLIDGLYHKQQLPQMNWKKIKENYMSESYDGFQVKEWAGKWIEKSLFVEKALELW